MNVTLMYIATHFRPLYSKIQMMTPLTDEKIMTLCWMRKKYDLHIQNGTPMPINNGNPQVKLSSLTMNIHDKNVEKSPFLPEMRSKFTSNFSFTLHST